MLYHLAAELRANSENRVTYINDCFCWICDKMDYILNEFVTTFHRDKNIDGKSIIEWCQDVEREENDKKEMMMMMMMIEALVNYTQKNNLNWLIIFDHHNALYNESVVHQFPFNIIGTLSQMRGDHIKVVLSTTINNHDHLNGLKGWYKHTISATRFDKDEYKIWCQIKLLDPQSQSAKSAFYWTGMFSFKL